MQVLVLILVVVLGVLVGIVVDSWLRISAAKKERAVAETERTELAQRISTGAAELSTARAEAAQSAERRAAFESVANEREKIILTLTAERDQTRAALLARLDSERTLSNRVSQLEADLRNERQNMAEKLTLLDQAKDALAQQFQALAADILEKKAQSFAEASQKDLGAILAPLREQIGEFRKKVEETQTDSKLGVNTLQTLIGNLNTMNQQLTEEAHNLSTALRGSAKAQGDWGEFILRDLLENSGLHQGEQYTFQQRFIYTDDEESRKIAITDVIIKLPGERHLIVDSKVSLDAYADSVNAPNELGRQAAIKRHIASVRNHISDLAGKRYQELLSLETLDFVVMFVPIEPAFFEVLRSDHRLWADAYKSKVLLVGPTTLLFVVKIVEELWAQEVKAQNYKEVMERGSQLYDKFVGFLADLESIGASLNTALGSFESAKKKLTGSDTSLVRQVDRLRALGVTPKIKKNKRKTSAPAVIPQRWLDGSVADGRGELLALTRDTEDFEEMSSGDEADGEAPEELTLRAASGANVDQAELALAAEAEEDTGPGI